MILFVVSVLLALGTVWRIAQTVPRGAQQFWMGVCALAVPWGLIANIVSMAGGLTPVWWVFAQAVLTASVFGAARHWQWPAHPFARQREWAWPEMMLAGALVIVLGLLAAQQWAQPLWIGDEIRYHASRVLYWIGQQSIFPYPTHNDRQTYFAYQGELAFLWPVLLTRLETAGRMIFWLGTPLACAGVFLVSRRLGASRVAALLVTLWFAVTPMVLRHGSGLKPEMWLTLYFLGAIWWLLEGLETNRPVDLMMSGVFFALAISTKLNVLAVVPVVLAAPWLTRGVTNRGRSFRAVFVGLGGGMLLSGIGLLLVMNTWRGGHPLGPAAMREVHSAALSGRQIRTHLARLPLVLIEPPMVSSAAVRTSLESAGRGLLAAVGADQPLELERPDAWPGQFVYTVAPVARNYSLGGLALVVILLAGALRIGREWVRERLISRESAGWLVMVSLLAGVILAVRWMVLSGVPERFLIPCFALAMPMVPALFAEKLRVLALSACLGVSGYQPAADLVAETKRVWTVPVSDAEILGQFAEAAEQIPAGAHILFFGNQDAPDYPLFGVGSGYDRRVTAWGKAPFSADALERVVVKEGITHILFQDGRTAYYHWDPPLALAPFVAWAGQRAGSRVLPLEAAHMVLVATGVGGAMQGAVAKPRHLLAEAPVDRPLITIDRELRGQLGIEAGRMATPWPIENLGADERGYLWLGTGPEEGLRFRIWCDGERNVTMKLRVGAGPSRTDSGRTMVLRAGAEAKNEQRESFTASGEVSFAVSLTRGMNRFLIYTADEATVKSMPNGDTRRLIVGLRDVMVESGEKVSGALIRGKGARIESGSVRGAWAIDDGGPPENEFLWLGSGEGEGVGFTLMMPKGGVAKVTALVSPGPSRSDRARHVALLVDGKASGERKFSGLETAEFRITASEGRHEIKFYATDAATVLKQANGDPRRLIALLHEINIEAGVSK